MKQDRAMWRIKSPFSPLKKTLEAKIFMCVEKGGGGQKQRGQKKNLQKTLEPFLLLLPFIFAVIIHLAVYVVRSPRCGVYLDCGHGICGAGVVVLLVLLLLLLLLAVVDEEEDDEKVVVESSSVSSKISITKASTSSSFDATVTFSSSYISSSKTLL